MGEIIFTSEIEKKNKNRITGSVDPFPECVRAWVRWCVMRYLGCVCEDWERRGRCEAVVAGSEAWEEARDTGLEVCGEGYLSSPGQYSERRGDDIRYPA